MSGVLCTHSPPPAIMNWHGRQRLSHLQVLDDSETREEVLGQTDCGRFISGGQMGKAPWEGLSAGWTGDIW
jgi:hypothetical protein